MLDKQQELQDQAEILSDYIELYAPYTTEEGLEQIFANRIALGSEILAFENGLTLEIRERNIPKRISGGFCAHNG